MNNILKIIFFSVITVLFFGCASNNNIKMTNGAVDTPAKKQRISKVINSHPNVKNNYNKLTKLQKKDKYESSTEYKARMSKKKLPTYVTMDIPVKRSYDPNTKLYKIYFETEVGPNAILLKRYLEGAFRSIPLSQGLNEKKTTYLAQDGSNRVFDTLESNAYGATVNVKNYIMERYNIHPDNITNILKHINAISLKPDTYGSRHQKHYVAIPMSKEKAKQLDKHKIKLKIGARITNSLTSLYKAESASEATISLPIASMLSRYGFTGHIKEFVIYDGNTKEILLQFAE